MAMRLTERFRNGYQSNWLEVFNIVVMRYFTVTMIKMSDGEVMMMTRCGFLRIGGNVMNGERGIHDCPNHGEQHQMASQ